MNTPIRRIRLRDKENPPSEIKNNKKSLTPRQRRYAELRVQGFDPEQAYYKAGYRGNKNHRSYIKQLEEMEEVQDEIISLFDSAMTEVEDLNNRERLFVAEYLKDNCGSRSVRAAGYETKYPAQMGHQLLQKPAIQKAIRVRQKDRERRTLITGDRIIRLLHNWADFDIRRLYRPDGSLKNVWELDDDCARAVQSIKVYLDKKGDYIKEIKLVNRIEPAKLIGQNLKLFTQVVEGGLDIGVKKIGVLKVPGMMDAETWNASKKKQELYQQELLGRGESGDSESSIGEETS